MAEITLDETTERLAESFAVLGGKEAAEQIAYLADLASLLEHDNGDPRWVFQMIAAIALGQVSRRTPPRKSHLRLITTEENRGV